MRASAFCHSTNTPRLAALRAPRSLFVRRVRRRCYRGVKRSLQKTVAEVMYENIVVTTSGNFSPAAFQCTRDVLGIDKIIFSIDWPYESNKIGIEFLKRLSLSPSELALVAHGNAERVLKL